MHFLHKCHNYFHTVILIGIHVDKYFMSTFFWKTFLMSSFSNLGGLDIANVELLAGWGELEAGQGT